MRLALSLLLLALLAAGAAALCPTESTLRRGLKGATATGTTSVEAPSITVGADTLATLSGYDKPLRATREEMFVTSRLTADTVTAIVIDIEYLDMQGRQIHRRDVSLDQTIPPGETRRVSFSSWDASKSFYYHLSTKPKRATGAPYRIRAKASRLTLAPGSNHAK